MWIYNAKSFMGKNSLLLLLKQQYSKILYCNVYLTFFFVIFCLYGKCLQFSKLSSIAHSVNVKYTCLEWILPLKEKKSTLKKVKVSAHPRPVFAIFAK